MSDKTDDAKKVSAFDTHEPEWVNIALEQRKVDPEPHCAKATVVDQIPRRTDLDLEARAPPKKRFWRYGRKAKIFVGVAVVAMLSIAIFVLIAVAVGNEESKGRQ